VSRYDDLSTGDFLTDHIVIAKTVKMRVRFRAPVSPALLSRAGRYERHLESRPLVRLSKHWDMGVVIV